MGFLAIIPADVIVCCVGSEALTLIRMFEVGNRFSGNLEMGFGEFMDCILS